MQVFICWSGPTSKRIAKALRDWLDDIFHGIRIYLSTEDMQQGKRWATDLAEQLAITDLGIVCLAPDNLSAPWVHFEAGVVSRDLKDGYVTSLLCGIDANDVSGPLAQFQNTPTDKENVFKLVKEINGRIAAGGPRRPDNKLTVEFESHWPKLHQEIRNALAEAGPSTEDGGAQDPVILTLERVVKLAEMMYAQIQGLQAEVQALRHSPYSARNSPAPTRRTPRRLRITRPSHVDKNQVELPF
jgi:hypothetical protein